MVLKQTILFESIRMKHVFQMNVLWKICLIIVCVLAAHLGETKAAKLEAKTNLIIDTDAGADDAVAILLALAVPETVKVVAITCTYGNTGVDNVEINVLKTLSIANKSDIPVYRGASRPYIHDYTPTDYFGTDGLGDFNFTKRIESIDKSKHAALAMVDLVKQHPGQISIVLLGPATNVALAASLDPNFTKNVKRFYLMGSSPSRVGFNFALDPESAELLLKSVSTLTKLVISSSAVPPNEMLSTDWRLNNLGKLNSERIEFINSAESMILKRVNYWPAADAITVAAAIWPELVTNSELAKMSSDACDPVPGSIKFQQKAAADNNVELVTRFNLAAFAEKLLKHLA